MSWLRQLVCLHEWVLWKRHAFLSGEPDIEKCLNCGKFRRVH